MTSASSRIISLPLVPYPADIDLSRTACIFIDMQVDFLQPGGFGERLGNDVSMLQRAIPPCRALLEAARLAGILVIHTREGHRPDLSDLHPIKLRRPGAPEDSAVIGRPGPRGRIMVRGEEGHDIIPELYPRAGEPVIDKPGKGSFYATDLECVLNSKNVTTLFVCGVTSEICVHTTIREANDRGFHCIMLEDCCASYNEEFHRVAVQMVSSQGGIFGSVTNSIAVIDALQGLAASEPEE